MLLESLQEYSALFLSKKTPAHERPLLKRLNLKNRMIGIVGAKGVGKTTLLLQFMNKQALSASEMLYISVDHPLISGSSILQIAKDFAALGGKLLVVDEIHNQENFAQDLKTIWDFLDIHVIFSGSSAPHLDQADLSRRVLKYTLPTLSFREFLELETAQPFEVWQLEEILLNHNHLSRQVLERIKPLKYFRDYLKLGFYPFYLEDRETFKIKLAEAISKTIDVDLLKIHNITPRKLANIKKLLAMLCVSVPYKPNMASLAHSVGVDPKTLYIYLDALQSGKLIKMIATQSRGEAMIKKPEKIFLDNPNLFEVLCQTPDTGALRESFFVSALSNAACSVFASQKGDFWVNNQYIFEIGGKNKSFAQIKNIENAFIAADNLESGFGNKIPLWMFGFLY